MGPYAAFQSRSYRLYILGWFAQLLGTSIQSVAVGWELYQRTGEPLALGLVGLSQAVPTMALAIPAGYLADRYNRVTLCVLSLGGMTITSLALAWLSLTEGSTTWIYGLLFFDAAAVIAGRPARVALVPQLVPNNVFPNAVMWNTSLSQIGNVVGPALGGIIVAFYAPAAYFVAAGTSTVFLLLLARLGLQSGPRRAGAMNARTLLLGIEYVWRKRIILNMITLDLFAVLLGGAVYLLPIYATDILDVGPTGFGILRAAPAVGALTMALSLVYLPPMKRAGRTLLAVVAGFGVATIIFGLSTNMWLSLMMLFLTGAFDNVSMVIRQTLLQMLTPDHMRGRVSAVSSVFVGASNELGGLESGLVAHWFGPVFSVVSGGIGTIVVVVVMLLRSSTLRNFGALHDARVDEEDEDPDDKPAVPLGTSTVKPPAVAADD
ncbi:MAG: MFS transporter [Litorilinea sp.]